MSAPEPDVAQLWQAHRDRRFPPLLGGAEARDVDEPRDGAAPSTSHDVQVSTVEHDSYEPTGLREDLTRLLAEYDLDEQDLGGSVRMHTSCIGRSFARTARSSAPATTKLAALRTQLAVAARTLHDDPADPDALEELEDAVKDMDAMLAFYEEVLVERGIQRPY